MEPHEGARHSVAGYLVVLVGAAGWVVGCFLPLYHIAHLGEGSITLSRQVLFGSIWSRVGGDLYLFGAISAVGVISMLAVLRIRTWTRFLLAGAVVAWSFVSVGALISLGGNIGQFNPGSTFGVGYWCCWASVIVVIAGTVMGLLAAKRQDADAGGMAPSELAS